MLPDHFYMTGLGHLVYWVLYLPASLGVSILAHQLLFKRISNRWLRWGIALPLAFFIATAPLLNVYSISMQAQQLCRAQGGLHVYKVVEAEGFLGEGSAERWTKYGFKYVESGGGDKMSRYTMQDGKVVHQRIQEFISRYQSKTGDNHVVLGKYFARSSELVIDRQTKEVLGELVFFSIYPGWLDNIAIGLTGLGSGFTPWSCGDEPPTGHKDGLGYGDVVMATIKPVKLNKGEAK